MVSKVQSIGPSVRPGPENVAGAGILDDLANGEQALDPNLVRKLPIVRNSGKGDGNRGDIDVATVYRWFARGLEYLQRPGGRITTESAVLRYFARLTAASTGQPVAVGRSPRRRLQDLKATEKRMAAAGL